VILDSPWQDFKLPVDTNPLLFHTQMFSKAIAIGLLSRAQTGNDLLAILDSLEADQSEQTINEIADILF